MVIIAINSTSAEYDRAKAKEHFMKIMEDCKGETKSTDADVKALMSKKMPESHEGLCMLECMFEKSGFMKDGKFDKDGSLEKTLPALNGDKEKEDKVKTMMNECDSEIGAGDGDKCVTAKKIVECIENKGKAFGFKWPGQE